MTTLSHRPEAAFGIRKDKFTGTVEVALFDPALTVQKADALARTFAPIPGSHVKIIGKDVREDGVRVRRYVVPDWNPAKVPL